MQFLRTNIIQIALHNYIILVSQVNSIIYVHFGEVLFIYPRDKCLYLKGIACLSHSLCVT